MGTSEAKEARDKLAKSILAKVDAATTEDAKVEVLGVALDKLAAGAVRHGMLSAMGGAIGFKSVLGGASFNFEDEKRVKCKKCEKEIIERYAKQRVGFCKACFESGLNEGEVIK